MVAAAILAGGLGQRMGGAVKPFLVVGGHRIIDRQLVVLRPLFDAVVIVAADRTVFDAAALGVEVISDRRGPGLGPLAGLEAALDWLPCRFDALVCLAGDMPFLVPAVLRYLRDVRPADAAAVVPRLADDHGDQQLQPLCARYHRAIAPFVAAELDAGTRAMHRFLRKLQQRPTPRTPQPLMMIDENQLRDIDATLATFVNINTPADVRSGRGAVTSP